MSLFSYLNDTDALRNTLCSVGRLGEDRSSVWLLDSGGNLRLTTCDDTAVLVARLMSTFLCLLDQIPHGQNPETRPRKRKGPSLYNTFIGKRLHQLAKDQPGTSRKERMLIAVRDYGELKRDNKLPKEPAQRPTFEARQVTLNF